MTLIHFIDQMSVNRGFFFFLSLFVDVFVRG